MAWIDSEQMWRMEMQKRSLANIASESESNNSGDEEDLIALNRDASLDKSSKAVRIEHVLGSVITCKEPPCHRNPPRFPSLGAYEIHHKQSHALVCLECKTHFPTERILSLHLEERHDPFVEAQRARHAYRYKCYVDGCKDVFGSVVKRNQHMIFGHYFPANYYFGVVKFGIDNRDSMLTKENFKDKWVRSKFNEKDKSTRDGNIATDMPEPNTAGDIMETDMDIMDDSIQGTEITQDEGQRGGIHCTSRSTRPQKIPIYGFQYRGIGIVKAKQKGYDRGQKK